MSTPTTINETLFNASVAEGVWFSQACPIWNATKLAFYVRWSDTSTPPTQLDGAVRLQASTDNESWLDVPTSVSRLRSSGEVLLLVPDAFYHHVRAAVHVTGGQCKLYVHVNGKA